jgi:hypothetical protein
LHYHPYKIQFAQELSEWDKVSQLQFCNEFLDLVKNNGDIVHAWLMSDKAHFRLSGYVNKQNFHFWAPNNPHELHQRPLHSARVTVYYAVSFHGIIGSYFFENVEDHTGTVNTEQLTSLSTRFAVVPTRWSSSSYSTNFLASPQDSVSQQTLFLILGITWPDLAVPDYFLWCYVRSKVYKVYETRPTSIYDLKHQILECVQGIPKALLQRVTEAFPLQLQEHIERHGGHLHIVILNDTVVTCTLSY